MAVILDTDLLDPRDRADAVHEAMARSGIPALVTHEPPPDQVHAHIQLWSLGGGVTLMHRVGSGVGLNRTPRQVRAAAPERLAVTVLGPGRWIYSQGAHDQRVEASRPRMVLTDHAAPYSFTRIGGGETFSLNLDHAALGLSVDQVRAAVGRVERSPVCSLVRTHVLALSADLDAIPAGPALGMLANAATELVRALIVSATADPDRAHAVITDSLALRIGIYIDEHLYDADLSPAKIAGHHHISLRQLYNVWARGNAETLGQAIMRKRLEAARLLLARTDTRVMTISAIARRCGFVDTAHFARKFRQAYGCSPREWRAIAPSSAC